MVIRASFYNNEIKTMSKNCSYNIKCSTKNCSFLFMDTILHGLEVFKLYVIDKKV